MSLSQETAETIALDCLAWLVGNEDLLPVFLGASGASIADMKTRAQDPEFLGAVLDFLLMDDAWVIEFCSHKGLANDMPTLARAMLPGGSQIDWT